MKLRSIVTLVLTALLAHAGLAAEPSSAPETITLASTTSVDNSGLLAAILPTFTKGSGITVHVLAQGTGQALATAARDDADLVLVHDPEAEERFIADGHGIERAQIAWNDFVVVGPRSDPAHIAGGHDAIEGFSAIAAAVAPFVSRGDKSGTDALESACGARRGSILPREAAANGIEILAAAWALRSMRRRPWMPIRSAIGVPGSALRTRPR
jgi:ABC-type tungstate transport system permease subunit